MEAIIGSRNSFIQSASLATYPSPGILGFFELGMMGSIWQCV